MDVSLPDGQEVEVKMHDDGLHFDGVNFLLRKLKLICLRKQTMVFGEDRLAQLKLECTVHKPFSSKQSKYIESEEDEQNNYTDV
jgi:hypothetical protein